jgi:virginiamycin A acetyltransferase
VKNDISIHPFSHIGRYTTIGRGTNINGKCFIGSCDKAKVVIGNYCAIAHGFRIRTRNHDMNYVNIQDKLQHRYQFKKLDSYKGDVIIGNNCWIGDNVTILPGVNVGNGV